MINLTIEQTTYLLESIRSDLSMFVDLSRAEPAKWQHKLTLAQSLKDTLETHLIHIAKQE